MTSASQDNAPPPQRVAPIVIPEHWELPGKPEGAPTSVQDAYRQTSFQLGPELRLFHEGMNLQVQAMRDSYPSRYRTLPLATMAMYWSRAFLALSDAALLLTRGAYASCPVLARSACEAIAAENQAGGEEQPQFRAWLREALQPNEQHRATDIGLGAYFAGSTLALHPLLGATFRAASELSRQHFGATLIEVAPESNRERLAVTFADQSFHFGWAQLILGWLLALCLVQLEIALAPDSPFFISDQTRAAHDGFRDRSARIIESPERCRVEEIFESGERRYLILNFRRQSTGAPRRLLL